LEKFREKYNEALKNQLAEYQLKRQKRWAKDSPSLDRQKKKIRVAGSAQDCQKNANSKASNSKGKF